MKTVYPNSELPHLWIHNRQDYARNTNDSISFNKTRYYSYNLCIGTRLNNTVFIYNSTYSNTTSKHISSLVRACSHKNIIYCAFPDYAISNSHEANFNDMLSSMESSIENLGRKRNKEQYLNLFEKEYNNYKLYIQALNLPKHQEIEDLYEKIINDTSEYVEKIKAEKKLKEEKEKAEFEHRLKLWRNNEVSVLSYFTYDDYTYLRWKNDRIETSKNITVPKNVAEYIWSNIQNKVYNVGDYLHNSIKYKVNKITDKYIQIGCHKLLYTECEKIWDIEVMA